MTRRKIRENVFKMLFRVEFHEKEDFGEQLTLFGGELDQGIDEELNEIRLIGDEDLAYINNKCNDIMAHLTEIDAQINEKSTGWKTTRMGKADLTIIRLAVYEILFEDDIPNKVAINEAVELAKAYGTDDSSSFVNGILAKFV